MIERRAWSARVPARARFRSPRSARSRYAFYNRRRRNIRQRQALTAVARGQGVADRYVRGGTLLNVYTGEVYPANVVIKGEGVVDVRRGDDMLGRGTRVIDGSCRVLC